MIKFTCGIRAYVEGFIDFSLMVILIHEWCLEIRIRSLNAITSAAWDMLFWMNDKFHKIAWYENYYQMKSLYYENAWLYMIFATWI